MSERTTERTRESDTEVAAGTEVGGDPSADQTSETAQTGSYVSGRALIVAFVAVGVGMTAGSLIPLVPYTALLGIPLGTFLHGLLDNQSRYVETALAGGLSAGVAVVLSLLPQLLAGLDGVRLFALAGTVGAVLALAGHYFGRDLRDGITRDIE